MTLSLENIIDKFAHIPPIEKAVDYLSNRKYKGINERRQIPRTIDHLTGLPNRQTMEHVSESMLRSSIDTNKDYHFLLLDIDFFKRINDCYGHPEGDIVLKNIGNILKDSVELYIETEPQAQVEVARWGGEEFAFSFVGTDPEGFAEYIRQEVESSNAGGKCIRPNGEPEEITVSIGIDTFRPDDTLQENGNPIRKTVLEDVRKKADSALCYAKLHGRNQTQKYEEDVRDLEPKIARWRKVYQDYADSLLMAAPRELEQCIPDGIDVEMSGNISLPVHKKGSVIHIEKKLKEAIKDGLSYLVARGKLKDTRAIYEEADFIYKLAAQYKESPILKIR